MFTVVWPSSDPMLAPLGLPVSSGTDGTVAVPLTTGASFTATTLVPIVIVPAEKPPVPPSTALISWAPVVGRSVPSETCAVNWPGTPLKFATARSAVRPWSG